MSKTVSGDTGTALVLGSSGFLGSHVTRELALQGKKVRVIVRPTSDTRSTRDLDIERITGDVFDPGLLREAMQGCDVVYYCIVDTRAWLRDPAPLYRTNIECMQKVLDVALSAGIEKFVYTSTFATIGPNPTGISTEEDAFDWPGMPPAYIKCRVDAEELFLDYCRSKGLPGVACCVGNTYGAGDFQPTPHGKLIRDVLQGRLPFYWDAGGPTVNIRDAARGLILAAEKGVVGERYILGGPWVTYRELFQMAARAGGVRAPRIRIPVPLMYRMASVAEFLARPLHIENKFSKASLDCSMLLPAVSSAKAERELGWQPGTVEQAVQEAVEWYFAHP